MEKESRAMKKASHRVGKRWFYLLFVLSLAVKVHQYAEHLSGCL